MTAKLEKLNGDLAQIRNDHEHICLWFSGGADSLLILKTLIAENIRCGYLRFDDFLTRQQKRFGDSIIIAEKIMVFSYPPVHFYFIAKGENVALVSEYSIDKVNQMMIVRDFVHGSKCAFGFPYKPPPSPHVGQEYDAHIWGTRKDDSHWSASRPAPSSEWRVGDKTFYAPLFDWTRIEVIETLKTFGINYIELTDEKNSGNIVACSRCIQRTGQSEVFCPKENKQIPVIDWNAEAELRIFQERVNGEKV